MQSARRRGDKVVGGCVGLGVVVVVVVVVVVEVVVVVAGVVGGISTKGERVVGAGSY